MRPHIKFVPVASAPVTVPEPVVRELQQIVVRETAPPKGWRFIPKRDENNLIVEIIATPIV